MKRLTRALIFLLGLFAVLAITYFSGPKLAPPTFPTAQYAFQNAATLTDLETEINQLEHQTVGIKPNNEARIIWADSLRKAKTKIVMLYLHGFGASYTEGSPVNFNIAKRFGCNLFLARLHEHGLDKGDSNLLNFNADKYVESAERALHIAKQLGDSVVIIGTSGGGALGLWLAARHPEIKGLLTYAPAIQIFRKETDLMVGPWGLQLARLISGKEHNDFVFKNPNQKLFWTNHQRFEGVSQFILFQKYAMIPATFSRVTCPFFMGYYYENEEKQDKTVSVAAMKEMFGQLGTPLSKKREINFPNTHSHVIASNMTSDDWQTVESESIRFIQEVLGLQ